MTPPQSWTEFERQLGSQTESPSTSRDVLRALLFPSKLEIPDVEGAAGDHPTAADKIGFYSALWLYRLPKQYLQACLIRNRTQKARCILLFVSPTASSCAAQHCHLSLRDYGQRFQDNSVNSFLIALFNSIACGSLPQVTLSRFDLFHGHLFVTRTRPARLGILFHAAEYPQLDPDFKINLGYCQVGSDRPFDQQALDCRNWIFFEGRLVSLNAGEDSILFQELLMEGLQPVRTMMETDFGEPLADINYFFRLQGIAPEAKLFVCPLSE